LIQETFRDAPHDRSPRCPDGRDGLPVGSVRHGRRHDPDRRAADADAAADRNGAARDYADGFQWLARLSVAGGDPHAGRGFFFFFVGGGGRAFLGGAHIRWGRCFFYLIGGGRPLGVFSIARYVREKPIALLLLGVT